nr:uncharacterized protein LOC125420010 [Ziziphus jujuba var. spinosa]XP_048322510.1 uncharacterized protein LOC125420010 [Ziziphus jujuba var. spinosa]XP_048322511.1 uncharacterized protein LOC125420010 [Ziziphus jujuba var. spinosa]
MKKGSMKTLDYCKKMKRIADKITVAGFAILEKELVMCILTRLGLEYETVYTNYTSRPPLPSLQEVQTSNFPGTLLNGNLSQGNYGGFAFGCQGGIGYMNQQGFRSNVPTSLGSSNIHCALPMLPSTLSFPQTGVNESSNNVVNNGISGIGPASAHFVATPFLVGDPNWYLDSEGTNHVVSSGQNLSSQDEYSGTNKLLVGNG